MVSIGLKGTQNHQRSSSTRSDGPDIVRVADHPESELIRFSDRLMVMLRQDRDVSG